MIVNQLIIKLKDTIVMEITKDKITENLWKRLMKRRKCLRKACL